MNIYHILYRTTNNINSKYYIGIHSTSNLDDGYLGSGKAIKHAVEKHGKDAFTKCILGIFGTRQEALDAEKLIVTEDVVNDPLCYNLMEGGYGGWLLTEDQRKAIGERSRKIWTGRKHKPSTIKKMKVQAQRRLKSGEYTSPERREKIRTSILKQRDQISERVSKDWQDKSHVEWRKKRIREGIMRREPKQCPYCDMKMRSNLERHIKARHEEA